MYGPICLLLLLLEDPKLHTMLLCLTLQHECDRVQGCEEPLPHFRCSCMRPHAWALGLLLPLLLP